VRALPDLSGRIALRPREAARAVGVSLGTLMSWRDVGLPHVCVGRCILVPVSELRTWLSSQVVRMGPEHVANSPGESDNQGAGAAISGAGGRSR
jgi:hypothetical protein